MKIANRVVGSGTPPMLIAEVAQTHDGSLGLAHAFIDAVADVGADAIKFQTHIAEAESTVEEQFRIKFSLQDATRFDYWKRMEFTPEQWQGLVDHASKRGLIFLSSVFSVAAVEMLNQIGIPAWKLGSGEISTPDILSALSRIGKPVIVSTGMSSFAEIAQAVDLVLSSGLDLALLQCTTRYPNPLETVGINVMDELRERFGCPVGLSDHSGSPYPALLAMARGADLLEVHVTLDRRMFGPDVSSSVDLDEFRLIANARNAFAIMDRSPVDKDEEAAKLDPQRSTFGKSVAPARHLPAGTVLEPSMLTLKKPGNGISPSTLELLIGRRLARSVVSNRLLQEEDLEPR